MPGRRELNFPSRAKRKALLEELRSQVNNPQAAANRYFRQYVQAMEELDKKMEQLSVMDENGVPKDLTDEDADELASSILNTATIGEKYLAAEQLSGKKITTGVPGMVNNLQGLMAKDFEALAAYDPVADPKSLAELQESTRTVTIDLRDRNLNTVGNSQNSRIPMTVVNATGQKRSGFFTKAKYMTAKQDFLAMIEKAKNACTTEEQKRELDKFLPGYKENSLGEGKRAGGVITENTSDTYIVGHLCTQLYEKYDANAMTDEDVQATLAVGKVDFTKIPPEAISVLKDGFNELKDNVSVEINAGRLEIDEGARLDNRNTAMSAVAGLLGFSKSVARSENMRFIDADGKVTEGTFMDNAKGIDLNRNPDLFQCVSKTPFGSVENRNKLFKQISDIQVNDFLSMNEDRTVGNLTYDVDEETGIVKEVECIDNDSSFGKSKKGGTNTVDRLRVITKSTSEKLLKLTPEMMKFTLRGRGLSDEEMNAAAERLTVLKNAIKNGRVEVVDDDQIGRRPITSYCPQGKKSNLFSELNTFFTKTAQVFRGDKPFKKLSETEVKKIEMKEVTTTSRKFTVGGLTDSLGKLSRKVEDKENNFHVDDLTNWRGSKQKFKDMVAAAKEAERLYKELTQNKQVDMSKLASEDPETAKRIVEAFVKADQTSDAYLEYKRNQRHAESVDTIVANGPYEQKHIQYAKDLKKITSEFFKTTSRPQTEAEAEDLQANQERRVLEDRRAEAQKDQINLII